MPTTSKDSQMLADEIAEVPKLEGLDISACDSFSSRIDRGLIWCVTHCDLEEDLMTKTPGTLLDRAGLSISEVKPTCLLKFFMFPFFA